MSGWPPAHARSRTPKSVNCRWSRFPPTRTPRSVSSNRSRRRRGRRKRACPRTPPPNTIQNIENKRASLVARMGEIMETTADDGRNPAGGARHGARRAQRASEIDRRRSRALARPREDCRSRRPSPWCRSSRRRCRSRASRCKPNVPIGTAFVRLACATLHCHGNKSEAADVCDSAGTTPRPKSRWRSKRPSRRATRPTRRGRGRSSIQNDHGRILAAPAGGDDPREDPGLREVPFNVNVPAQTAGGTYGWVGEAEAEARHELAFAMENLGVRQSRRRSSC